MPKTILGRPTVELIRPWMPLFLQRLWLRFLLGISVGDYRKYGLPRPDHRIFDRHPTINSLFLYYLKHGSINTRPDIARFAGRTVVFTDGPRETFDVVVAGTGFEVHYPFLSPALVPIKNNVPALPGGMLHPRYRGLYLMGWAQNCYGVGPIVSASARALVAALRAQEQARRPLGMILERMGFRPPRTRLANPGRTFRESRRLPRRLHLALWLEESLFRYEPYVPPAVEQFPGQGGLISSPPAVAQR
mgnify:CR=1 FL=1